MKIKTQKSKIKSQNLIISSHCELPRGVGGRSNPHRSVTSLRVPKFRQLGDVGCPLDIRRPKYWLIKSGTKQSLEWIRNYGIKIQKSKVKSLRQRRILLRRKKYKSKV